MMAALLNLMVVIAMSGFEDYVSEILINYYLIYSNCLMILLIVWIITFLLDCPFDYDIFGDTTQHNY